MKVKTQLQFYPVDIEAGLWTYSGQGGEEYDLAYLAADFIDRLEQKLNVKYTPAELPKYASVKDMPPETNYVVHITDSSGSRYYACDTKDQVWVAMGYGNIGRLYTVESPVGLCVEEFIAF